MLEMTKAANDFGSLSVIMRQPGKPISWPERTVGVVIILLLVTIAAGILLKQSSLNPAVLVARGLALTKSRVEPSAAVVPWFPPELKEFGAPESFSPDNLYDKIDGKAELYLAAGFVQMRCQRFALKNHPDDWVEWFVYQMAGTPQAFSVFSTQRRSEGQPLDFTKYAYRTPNALFFTSGSNYVEAVASSASEPVMNAVLQMAQRFNEAGARNPEPAALGEMQMLPRENLVAASESLQTSDAFGFDQFKNVYTAQYNISGTELMAFVTSTGNASEATKLRDAYRSFLLANGGREVAATTEFGKPIEIMGTFEIVFSHGAYVGGIHAAPALPAAEQLARQLKTRIPAQ